MALVEGVVTVDDKPLPLATLTFVPEEGSPSYGQTDKSGKYTLMFTDTKYGAMLGKHTVSIEVSKLSKGEIEEMKAQGMDVPSSEVTLPKEIQETWSIDCRNQKGKEQDRFRVEKQVVSSPTELGCERVGAATVKV